MLNIRIPKSLQRELKALSREEKTPLSELVRKSLRNLLRAREFYALRRTGKKYARKQGLITDEDFFE